MKATTRSSIRAAWVAGGRSCLAGDRRVGYLSQRYRDRHDQSGYFLIELLIYLGVLVIVMGVAFGAFYRCLDSSRNLARNAEDVIQAVRAGELWRADIRLAIASPETIADGAVTACEIPQTGGRVAYILSDGALWRKTAELPAVRLVARVNRSMVYRDERDKVTSWRWELELKTRKRESRLRPLFTFQAVPMQRLP